MDVPCQEDDGIEEYEALVYGKRSDPIHDFVERRYCAIRSQRVSCSLGGSLPFPWWESRDDTHTWHPGTSLSNQSVRCYVMMRDPIFLFLRVQGNMRQGNASKKLLKQQHTRTYSWHLDCLLGTVRTKEPLIHLMLTTKCTRIVGCFLVMLFFLFFCNATEEIWRSLSLQEIPALSQWKIFTSIKIKKNQKNNVRNIIWI